MNSTLSHNHLEATIGKSVLKASFSNSFEEHNHIIQAMVKYCDFCDELLNDIAHVLEDNFDRISILSNILVEQCSRGQGVGRQLMNEYKDKVANKTEINILFARHENPQKDGFCLISFYQSCGFEPIKSSNGEMLMVSKEQVDTFKQAVGIF